MGPCMSCLVSTSLETVQFPQQMLPCIIQFQMRRGSLEPVVMDLSLKMGVIRPNAHGFCECCLSICVLAESLEDAPKITQSMRPLPSPSPPPPRSPATTSLS